MSQVFVSYARESHDAVKQLVIDIGALGHDAWFDEELSGGVSWWETILRSIRDCDVFVFALSPESIKSVACKKEYAYALALHKAVVPVLVGDGVVVELLPESLASTHFVDYRKFDKPALKDLLRALSKLPVASALPVPLPEPPPAPLSHLGSLSEQIESAAPLGFDAQMGLLMRLKQSLRDSGGSGHALGLLQKFRAREDLLAIVASEIDHLLPAPSAKAGQPEEARPPGRGRERPSRGQGDQAKLDDGAPPRFAWKPAAIVAGVLAGAGLVLSFVNVGKHEKPADAVTETSAPAEATAAASAPAPAPEPAAATFAAANKGDYFVSLHVGDVSAARATVEQIQALGLIVEYARNYSGAGFEVRVGPFGSIERANDAASAVREKTGLSATVK